MRLGWSSVAPLAALDAGWPFSQCDPKWAFPWLDLAISLPRSEGDKKIDAIVNDGWAPLEPTINLKDF